MIKSFKFVKFVKEGGEEMGRLKKLHQVSRQCCPWAFSMRWSRSVEAEGVDAEEVVKGKQQPLLGLVLQVMDLFN